MAKRLSRSQQHVPFANVLAHYRLVAKAIRHYYQPETMQPSYQKIFQGYTRAEVIKEMYEHLTEHDKASALTLCAAIEAAFHLDFHTRIEKRYKDTLSRHFRALHKRKLRARERIQLQEDILKTWLSTDAMSKNMYDALLRLLKYRHWLAHGRYWQPKQGRQAPRFDELYLLATEVDKLLDTLNHQQI